MTGTVPRELGQLAALELLALHSNLLTGSIPSELGQMTTLETLYFQSNHLTGTLPDTLGELEFIDELWLHDNQIVGTLPTDIWSLSMLRSLFRQNNLLTGHLDNSFNHTTQLELATIDVSNNQLSGSLSPELFLLPQLRVLSLSGKYTKLFQTSFCFCGLYYASHIDL